MSQHVSTADELVDAYCKAWGQSFLADNQHHTVLMTEADRKHIAAGLKAALERPAQAIRDAIEQPAPAALVDLTDGEGNALTLMQALDHAIRATKRTSSVRLNKILLAAKQALTEQPVQQEPVAWIVEFDDGHVETTTRPVSDWKRGMWESAGKRFAVKPLYTRPQAREPLTDEKLMKCLIESGCARTTKMSVESGPYSIDRPTFPATRLCRAIEATHDITWEQK